ncbi:MAG: hypothetical protein Q4P65_01015 [Eubacteriales bacterium]|nr:hypothetical protein [Eubacteriales bacterium]
MSIKEEGIFGINFCFSLLLLPVQAIIAFFLWTQGLGPMQIGGFSANRMVLYYIFQNILMITYQSALYVAYEVSNDISSGNIIVWLFRPISYAKLKYAEKFGFFILRMAVGYLSFIIFSVILKQNISIIQYFLSLACTIIGFTLLFQIQLLIGLLAFRLKNVLQLRDFVMDILWILGGTLLPLDFFPVFLRDFLQYTVIPLVYYLPGKILLTQLSTVETWVIFASAISRIVVYSLLIKLLWRLDSMKANQGA